MQINRREFMVAGAVLPVASHLPPTPKGVAEVDIVYGQADYGERLNMAAQVRYGNSIRRHGVAMPTPGAEETLNKALELLGDWATDAAMQMETSA